MLHRRLRLVGYIRTGGTAVSSGEQRLMIQQYCSAHNHDLIGCSQVDTDRPSFGFEEALQALKHADGIIALDIDRFSHRAGDHLLDVRPLVDRLLHTGKVLITLTDGIETVTASGQASLLELLHEWSDQNGVLLPTKGDFESIINRNVV